MNKSSTRFVARIASAIALAWTAAVGVEAGPPVNRSCQQGDRGRLIGYQKVGSYPTPDDARAHFEQWIAFYQDFFDFPENLPVTFEYRLRQLQGDLLHGRRGTAGGIFRSHDHGHRDGVGAAQIRAAPDGGLRARNIDFLLRRPVESEYLWQLQLAG